MALPPTLSALGRLAMTGDGVLSSRYVDHVGQTAVRPSHPPHFRPFRVWNSFWLHLKILLFEKHDSKSEKLGCRRWVHPPVHTTAHARTPRANVGRGSTA